MMPARQRTTTTTADWHAMLQALEDRHRRRLLDRLLDHHPNEDTLRVPEDVYVGEEDLDVLQEQLYHHHLPTLDAAGYINWEREDHEVEQGPKFNNIRPLLQLVRDHQDELPPGWV